MSRKPDGKVKEESNHATQAHDSYRAGHITDKRCETDQ